MKYFLFFFFLCSVFFARADISTIPKRDLNHVKYLFEDLIDCHDFSYTLFGSKPMSLADYELTFPSPRPIHRWIRSIYLYLRSKVGLNTWYRYRDEFHLQDFIFLDEEKDWINNCLVLFFINKKNMLLVLHEHESIFKEELGSAFKAEIFLEKLEKREISLAKAINQSQRLMGIMLGYGVRNSTIFQERFEIMKAISKREKDGLPEDEELKQKLNVIDSQIECFEELDADAIIHPLYFLADPSHPETISLQQKYEQERQQITELRKKSNFMDLVLNRLVSAE